MKAMVRETYGPPDVLRLADVPTPANGNDCVLVRVHRECFAPCGAEPEGRERGRTSGHPSCNYQLALTYPLDPPVGNVMFTVAVEVARVPVSAEAL